MLRTQVRYAGGKIRVEQMAEIKEILEELNTYAERLSEDESKTDDKFALLWAAIRHHLIGPAEKRKERVKHIVEFRGEQCHVVFARYGNDRIAIQLMIDATGEPMTKASMNLYQEECGPRQTFIKDYSDNEGILAVLTAAGIVKDTGVKKKSGFCEYALVDVLV